MEDSALAIALKKLFEIGPLIFGLGFLWPLTTQIILQAGWTPPFGLTPMICGLLVGGALGLMAQIRGRWI